ncbi:diguanylate cyclase (GGDEF)-like protein [Gibbsiella quercinecans]|uniref:diguanylate cyclase n=1 Tax=Gibbsiella quercinecans TaxID=929813 RepID=A0A250B4L7_9GAMM|nr:diguanylate cyclase [Gibbsiella quercinecans]ATA21119.1 diguanylate cyclase [Gibbsiella quercinecans]RLM02861.1 diguanylate cyclase [Gibbsiella quercinecans]RLM03189.1 diguanylate cyclase [Gibbsiella quercinecans]TCT80513.1 diguanylate cyclase (GGDEF)-like protein [Gibbsiella quercinecans]
MYGFFKQHGSKLLLLAFLANLGLLLELILGEVKPWAEIHWTDVLAEGGSALLALSWLIMLLVSRPAGRVTTLLALGLACIFFSWWIDSLDEFIRLPHDVSLGKWLEDIPMPIGLILITLGIYHWHQEQLAISAQLNKRERLFREHLLFDKLTPLGGADYLRKQLSLSLKQAAVEQQPLSLIVVDLNDFDAINQRFGAAEGDYVLQTLCQLLLLNLRQQDLLCRLAGDRFVALLPNTGEQQAKVMAQDLAAAIAHLAHHTQRHGERVRLQASVAAVMAMDEDRDALLLRLNQTLSQAKQIRVTG